ncbi:MAG: sugar kinase [Candidatus Cloacimonetes bacterium]|nr:sugar kinase [Candidatus Cloacimonadota bacterium]
MKLLVVGSIALDNIQTPFGNEKRSLGGSAIFTSMVSNNFCQTGLVGIVGEDFPKEYIELLSNNNIDLKDLSIVPGKTFHWSGKYDNFNTAETIVTDLNVFANFNPILNWENKQSEYLFLGNIDPILQLKVLDQMENVKITACDTMNYWIMRSRENLLKVIKKVDFLFINEEELRMLTKEQNIFQAADEALKMGSKHIIVKRGEYGSFIYTADFIFFMPVFPVKKVIDPTGAGDSFAGGFMGFLASEGKYDELSIKKAMIYGTITASFCVESFSIKRIKELTLSDILNRKQEIEKKIFL